jgi:hypothetical protein
MIPAESSPSSMFSQLFLNGTPAEIAMQRRKLQQDRSILDGLMDQTKTLMRKASALDRARLEVYLESIRKTEKDLLQAGAWQERPKPTVDQQPAKDVSDKRDIIERIRLMFDLIPLILQTDSTRVINMGIQVDHGIIKMDGIHESHHSISHHGQDPSKIKQLKRVESAILECFSDLLQDLKRDEADGSRLLDNTSLLFGSNLGNANNHDYRNLPIVMSGGGFKHGNQITFDRKNNQPLSNLFLTMLNRTGIETDSFSASTGTLDWS